MDTKEIYSFFKNKKSKFPTFKILLKKTPTKYLKEDIMQLLSIVEEDLNDKIPHDAIVEDLSENGFLAIDITDYSEFEIRPS